MLEANSIESRVEAALEVIRSLERIGASAADWKTKYDLIFTAHRHRLKLRLDELGLRLAWYDPDMDYEDDVRAYLKALAELRERLEPVLAGVEAA